MVGEKRSKSVSGYCSNSFKLVLNSLLKDMSFSTRPNPSVCEPVTVAIATQGGFVEHGYPHVSNPAVRAKPTEVGGARQAVNHGKTQVA